MCTLLSLRCKTTQLQAQVSKALRLLGALGMLCTFSIFLHWVNGLGSLLLSDQTKTLSASRCSRSLSVQNPASLCVYTNCYADLMESAQRFCCFNLDRWAGSHLEKFSDTTQKHTHTHTSRPSPHTEWHAWRMNPDSRIGGTTLTSMSHVLYQMASGHLSNNFKSLYCLGSLSLLPTKDSLFTCFRFHLVFARLNIFPLSVWRVSCCKLLWWPDISVGKLAESVPEGNKQRKCSRQRNILDQQP